MSSSSSPVELSFSTVEDDSSMIDFSSSTINFSSSTNSFDMEILDAAENSEVANMEILEVSDYNSTDNSETIQEISNLDIFENFISNFDNNNSDLLNNLRQKLLDYPTTFLNVYRPGISYTLSEYLQTFHNSSFYYDNELDYLKEALYGTNSSYNYDNEGFPILPYINFSEYEMNNPFHVTHSYDIDSFLYTTKTLSIINTSIEFYPFPKKSWNLTHHNHEYWPIKNSNNKEINIQLVNIPHYKFGQFGLHNSFNILIFFPKLYNFNDSKHNTFISNEILSKWYDNILLPSLKKTYPSYIIQHFPNSFHIFLTKSKTNYYIYSPYGLPQKNLSKLTENIIKEIDIVSKSHNDFDYKQFEDFFFHIFAKNLKNFTSFKYINSCENVLNDILKYFSFQDNDLKNQIKLDLGMEFMPIDLTEYKSVYWKRDFSLKILNGLNSNPRIDNWALTYDICGTVGETKDKILKNYLFYTQTYHSDKEILSASIPTLLNALDKNDAIYNSSKIQKACTETINILNNIIPTNYSARLEYRLSYQIFYESLNIIDNKRFYFLQAKPFYLIPTLLATDFRAAKLQTFLQAYNLSINSSILSQKVTNYKYCLFLLMRSINQSFEIISESKMFGNSDLDNQKNIGTLELYRMIKQSNTAWLLNDIFDIENCELIIKVNNFNQFSRNNSQQLLVNNSNSFQKISNFSKESNLENEIIDLLENFNNQIDLLVDKIWLLFIEDCINKIYHEYIQTKFNEIELTIESLRNHMYETTYEIVKLSSRRQFTTIVDRFNLYFNIDNFPTGQGWKTLNYIKYYRIVYEEFNSIFQTVHTKLSDKFENQIIVPLSEKGKFIVSKRKASFINLSE
jgi:hypothetical protein